MKDTQFFETMMDNLVDGIYVLDDKGNYIFVNSAYSKMLNMPKDLLLSYNVHDFLDTGQIDICISDIVYKDKKQVIMFQDVEDTQGYGRKPIRQIVISRPIFNDKGEVSMILATVRPLDKLNDIYYRASQNTSLSSFQLLSRSGAEREDHMIAESEEMKRILEVASTVATVDTSILITGESGTGKEVVAQYVHQASPRSKKNLVVINCASLPEHLLEAELFGYEKGAFTGASAAGKKGLFEEADGSTLFLDEINSMPIDLQGKILRAIETKTIQRVGSTVSKKVDFRVLSATNEDLEKLVEEKRFRADLYYRLAVVPIHLPPLRERKADILPLAEYFLSMFCRKYSKDKAFTDLTRQTMMSYCWPGNVRELKNFVERSVVMSIGRNIEIKDVASFIGSEIRTNPAARGEMGAGMFTQAWDSQFEEMLQRGVPLEEYMEQCEKGYLNCAFEKYQNSYKVADALGTSQSLIMRRKKKYGL